MALKTVTVLTVLVGVGSRPDDAVVFGESQFLIRTFDSSPYTQCGNMLNVSYSMMYTVGVQRPCVTP